MAAPSLRRHLLAHAACRLKREKADDGAAAVEFALVLPILVLILFGIIDYGLYFSNSIGARSGLESAVRQAVVDNIDTNCPTPTDHAISPSPSSEVGQLICMVKQRSNPVSGETFVKVVLPDNTAGAPQSGWIVGQPLLVCEVIEVKGVTGYVPLPRSDTGVNGVIRDKVVMQIERHDRQDPQHDDHDNDADASAEEQDPPGGWSWCTV